MVREKGRRSSQGDTKKQIGPFPFCIDGSLRILQLASLGVTARTTATDGSARIVLLPEDFRQAGFKAGELVGIEPLTQWGQATQGGDEDAEKEEGLGAGAANRTLKETVVTDVARRRSDGGRALSDTTVSDADSAVWRRFTVGHVMPLQSPVLKKGVFGVPQLLYDNLERTGSGIGGIEASTGRGGRVRVRRLSECPEVAVFPLLSVHLTCIQQPREDGGRTALGIGGYSAYRLQLFEKAVGFSVRGGMFREGDRVNVSFEGRTHGLLVTKMDLIRSTVNMADVGVSAAAPPAATSDGDVDSLSQQMASVSFLAEAGEKEKGMKGMKVEKNASLRRHSASGGAGAETELVKGVAAGKAMSIHDKVVSFYRTHNPEKLSSVDDVVAKYVGREEQLLQKLCIKYQVDFAVFMAETTSGSSSFKDANGAQGCNDVHAPPSLVAASPKDSMVEASRHRREPAVVLGHCEAATRCVLVVDPQSKKQQEQKSLVGEGSEAGETGRPMGKPGAAAEGGQGVWASVGGLATQVKQLMEAIELPLCHPEKLARYGVKPARGVLLYGPPGSGKTSLARAAAAACGVNQIVVNGPDLVSRYVGESEAALVGLFRRAASEAPCLIVLDEVDALCPRRDLAASESERRIVSTVLALMDSIDTLQQVAVVACTNRPFALDPALRRPGRLDREIEVGVPNDKAREEILWVQLRRVPHSLSVADVARLAAMTHGFMGADLQLLVKEAVLLVLERPHQLLQPQLAQHQLQSPQSKEETKGGTMVVDSPGEAVAPPLPPLMSLATSPLAFCLTVDDMQQALPKVKPSGLREVAVEVPKVKWSDIGGQAEVKQLLQEVAEWPLKHPEVFKRMGISPPRGVLLYGPPGCSKTLMARALSTESGMNFIAVKGPELLSKWLGESERALQTIFKRARAAAPTIVFFDEIDALAGKRGGGDSAGATERVLTQLLTELDGIQPLKRVVVVAATNRPDVVDPALLRPGRLDRLVYVPPPDHASRLDILKLSMKNIPHEAGSVDLNTVATRTEGYSGAEVVSLCREAALVAIEEDFEAKVVEPRHLLKAMGAIVPAITPAMLAFYADYNKR